MTKKFNLGNSKSIEPASAGCKNNSFLHFKCYNLAIHVVNFFEKNSTHYFNTQRQDPMVGTQEIEIQFNFMQFAIGVIVLECSL
jgi:hypothetical protein